MAKWVKVNEINGRYTAHYFIMTKGGHPSTTRKNTKATTRNYLPEYVQDAMALLDLYEKINGVGRKDAYESKGITTQVYFIKRK